jgi:cytochrome c oxidase subunit IV|tara:strand:+ start:52139 stop:52477 length:339 start_codon:yes stop_codon:yes gene_type:complete
MSNNVNESNWWIWKVFWILLFITALEVLLGILKVNEVLPEFLINDKFLGLEWLTHIFIVLTLVKAAYIVNIFMHLGFEKKSLQLTILIPAFILIPYLLFIIITEALYANIMI